MNIAYKIIIIYILIFNVIIGITKGEFDLTEAGNSTAEIDYNIFYRSVPDIMKMGESYTVKVFVRNTGHTYTKFLVTLSTYEVKTTIKNFTEVEVPTGEFYIYRRYDSKLIELKDGESRRLEFIVVPIKPYIGKLEVSANLYKVEPDELTLLDNARKRIHIIKPAVTKEEQLLISVLIIVILIGMLIRVVNRNR